MFFSFKYVSNSPLLRATVYEELQKIFIELGLPLTKSISTWSRDGQLIILKFE